MGKKSYIVISKGVHNTKDIQTFQNAVGELMGEGYKLRGDLQTCPDIFNKTVQYSQVLILRETVDAL